MLPPLFGAQITRFTRNGMVIQGSELDSRVPGSSKAKVATYRQTWWLMVMCSAVEGCDVLEEMADGNNPLLPIPHPAAVSPAWKRALEPGGSDAE